MRLLAFSLAALLAWSSFAQAETAALVPVAVQMSAAAQQFLDSLDPKERPRAMMAFDDPQRLDWTNVPKPTRKGIQLREMSLPQREKCHALLRASLSPAGYEKACRIMSLENNLREGEKNLTNGQLRDPERYFLTIFGTPGQQGVWGYSFEGHHLSLNFVVKDGEIFSDSPSFWGANPATVSVFVENGPENGVRTLTDEEQLAFDLVNALDDTQRQKAIIAAEAPSDYRGVGSPKPPEGPAEGLSVAEMTPAQKQTLWKLLEVYTGHLPKSVAAARQAEIKEAGVDQVHFAWLGATKPGVGHAYRIQGPTFALDLVNVQSDPAGNKANHIHSVWRSLKHDFGMITAATPKK
ncbi:DUF3500 domain-containing protein [Planctomicrobium piriforme]|nr:DUF3500 domain-containing protein [Planctomicrobium piriforme]